MRPSVNNNSCFPLPPSRRKHTIPHTAKHYCVIGKLIYSLYTDRRPPVIDGSAGCRTLPATASTLRNVERMPGAATATGERGASASTCAANSRMARGDGPGGIPPPQPKQQKLGIFAYYQSQKTQQECSQLTAATSLQQSMRCMNLADDSQPGQRLDQGPLQPQPSGPAPMAVDQQRPALRIARPRPLELSSLSSQPSQELQ